MMISSGSVGTPIGTPAGIALNHNATFLYVCDSAANAVRRVALANGAVTLVAGGNSAASGTCQMSHAQHQKHGSILIIANFNTHNHFSGSSISRFVTLFDETYEIIVDSLIFHGYYRII